MTASANPINRQLKARRTNVSDEHIIDAPDVFISYAHKDAEHDVANARMIGQWLEAEGYTVWWDRSMLFGDWQAQLKQKADKAQKVIVLWSPKAAASRVVYAECFIAAGNGTLAPVIIEPHPAALPAPPNSPSRAINAPITA